MIPLSVGFRKAGFLVAIVASQFAVLQHVVVILSLANSPSSVLLASRIIKLVLAWRWWRGGVVQVC